MTPIRDVDELRRAIELCGPDVESRRYIYKEARRLGRVDIVPRGWGAARTRPTAQTTNVEQTLTTKSQESGLALAKLRCVYMRGVEEHTKLGSNVLSCDDWAQARVNSFIRLSAGSSLVRQDDVDLLGAPHAQH